MEKLLEYLKANRGAQGKMARAIGLGQSTISQWKSVPLEHLPEVEAFTGIPRWILCPDAYRPAKPLLTEDQPK